MIDLPAALLGLAERTDDETNADHLRYLSALAQAQQDAKEKRDAETEAGAIYYALKSALMMMAKGKPAERSELSRRYAVTITMMEQVIAYFDCFVVHTLNYGLLDEDEQP